MHYISCKSKWFKGLVLCFFNEGAGESLSSMVSYSQEERGEWHY